MSKRSVVGHRLPVLKVSLRLKKLGNRRRACEYARFFKTGPGEYGEGDLFIGVTVPAVRRAARQFVGLSLPEVRRLLRSQAHEERLAALVILTEQFARTNKNRRRIYDFYLQNTAGVNNWDLVDVSAYKIVGEYLLTRPAGEAAGVLSCLARSKNLWERRMAIIATLAFIKKKKFGVTFRVAKILLYDPHDLIHKAVGWMLREVGKMNRTAEEIFLQKYCRIMPRTMIRYAVEKFPKRARQRYLPGYLHA